MESQFFQQVETRFFQQVETRFFQQAEMKTQLFRQTETYKMTDNNHHFGSVDDDENEDYFLVHVRVD